jgi:hypothetical protein
MWRCMSTSAGSHDWQNLKQLLQSLLARSRSIAILQRDPFPGLEDEDVFSLQWIASCARGTGERKGMTTTDIQAPPSLSLAKTLRMIYSTVQVIVSLMILSQIPRLEKRVTG